MMTIDEMKEKFLKGELEQGIFSSRNDERQGVIVEIGSDGFRTITSQDNGWLRINTYTYDKEDKEWIMEETYER